MSNYKVTVSLPAVSEDEAKQKAQALAVFATLDAKTLTGLARVVQNDPGKINLAKRFLGL